MSSPSLARQTTAASIASERPLRASTVPARRPSRDPAAEDPDAAELLQAARAALRAKTGAAEAVRGNRITAGRPQLRLGRDLRWYPYARSDQEWEPSGPPQADPVLAVADLERHRIVRFTALTESRYYLR
jgi:hypothetical protein